MSTSSAPLPTPEGRGAAISALCRAYETVADAERAVDALLGGGVPGDDVRLLMGAEIHDARTEAAGGFAGSVGAHTGVGNADRDVVVTYTDGREHSRVAGHRALKRLLVDAGLDEDSAESDVRALHHGRVLVLVSSATISSARAAELIDAPAR
jgi:hypothetical protein